MIGSVDVYQSGGFVPLSSARADVRAEYLRVKIAQAKRAHRLALAGRFNVERDDYLNWLILITVRNKVTAEELLEYLAG